MILEILMGLVILVLTRIYFINCFKLNYYETKLKHRDIDISSVENIGLIQIIKL